MNFNLRNLFILKIFVNLYNFGQ